jgi:hypothetical protein
LAARVSGSPLPDKLRAMYPFTIHLGAAHHSKLPELTIGSMHQMSLRVLLIAIGLGASATTAHAASPCPDPGAVCNIQCYDAYCSVWRACWVTETGIGVCSAPRYGRAPRLRR